MMEASHENGRAFHYEGGTHAVLLLHGFTGTPGTLRPVGEALRKAGYAVDAPMLPGHGTSLADMRASNWRAWIATARAAYAKLREGHERVTVAGLSMGGALALILAEEYPVDGLITWCAPIVVRDWRSAFAPLLAPFVPVMPWKPVRHEGDWVGEYDCGYDGMPVARVYDLNRVIHLAKSNLYAITAPALIVQSALDETVNPVSAKRIYDGVSSTSKRTLTLERSTHVCTLGPEREALIRETLDFLKDVENGAQS